MILMKFSRNIIGQSKLLYYSGHLQQLLEWSDYLQSNKIRPIEYPFTAGGLRHTASIKLDMLLRQAGQRRRAFMASDKRRRRDIQANVGPNVGPGTCRLVFTHSR